MVHPSSAELVKLRAVAREILDTGEESGYTVDEAIARPKSIERSVAPTRSLERSMILDAAERGAHKAGMSTDSFSGSLELVSYDRGLVVRYRVKRGSPDRKSGGLKFICGAGSALISAEPDALIATEQWILGYQTDDEHTATALLAGRVIGWSGDGPVKLDLDSIIDLTEVTPPSGFRSSDEGLDGFSDDFGEESGLG